MTLIIETHDGKQFEIKGINYEYKDGIHYLNGQSFPDEIVKEVIPSA